MNRRRCLGDRQQPLYTTNTKYHPDSRKYLGFAEKVFFRSRGAESS